ncbi:NAD-dependent epimerase/dehydratase family protein [Nocardioides sp. W3-2-3]|uniref:NAD-dependent epimerase/dehydratase family protein n=1 Tax=Nocardioides convexus TaxID=2712224 RepID=UPI002418A6B3|nr:NAD-dependent epimerase/dehydratase family protein [Nocardioides convexus]NGZ99567.1 NAD-dependent epimerase/dehydratase family protein [Nocardioides convexus]
MSSSSRLSVVVAGSSGFLGRHLVDALREHGHDVTTLVRREPGAGESRWAPQDGQVDAGLVQGADVVVNLAGAPLIGNPHSRAWARDVRTSRVTTTGLLARTIAAAPQPPALVNASGISLVRRPRHCAAHRGLRHPRPRPAHPGVPGVGGRGPARPGGRRAGRPPAHRPRAGPQQPAAAGSAPAVPRRTGGPDRLGQAVRPADLAARLGRRRALPRRAPDRGRAGEPLRAADSHECRVHPRPGQAGAPPRAARRAGTGDQDRRRSARRRVCSARSTWPRARCSTWASTSPTPTWTRSSPPASSVAEHHRPGEQPPPRHPAELEPAPGRLVLRQREPPRHRDRADQPVGHHEHQPGRSPRPQARHPAPACACRAPAGRAPASGGASRRRPRRRASRARRAPAARLGLPAPRRSPGPGPSRGARPVPPPLQADRPALPHRQRRHPARWAWPRLVGRAPCRRVGRAAEPPSPRGGRRPPRAGP